MEPSGMFPSFINIFVQKKRTRLSLQNDPLYHRFRYIVLPCMKLMGIISRTAADASVWMMTKWKEEG
jgi:hypothetical protein